MQQQQEQFDKHYFKSSFFLNYFESFPTNRVISEIIHKENLEAKKA